MERGGRQVRGVLVLVVLLGGAPTALAPGGSPHVDCGPLGTACNVKVTNGPANEVMVAVNPTNADNLIAVAKDYRLGPGLAGALKCTADGMTNVWAGTYRTVDGGRTWTTLLIPPTPGDVPRSSYQCTSDPVVAFNSAGTAFFSGLGLIYAATDAAANRGIWVAKSTDGGATWPTINTAYSGSALTLDKEWIATDPRVGSDVYLAWTSDPVIGRGWSHDGEHWENAAFGDLTKDPQNPDCQPGNPGDPLPSACTQLGAQPVISKTGAYTLAWASYTPTPDILVAHSSDLGRTLDGDVVLVKHAIRLTQPAYRVETLPSLAVDLSDGARAGYLYVAWHDQDGGSPDIYVSRSADGGAHWSSPVRVTDDGPSALLQFHPAVSVGPDGTVHIAWYDQRNDNDPSKDLLDVYYSSSSDGGVTWSPNLRVSGVSFDPALSHHQNGFAFMGEYLGLTVGSDGVAHPVWADTHSGLQAEIYTARVVQ